ncbi:MAG: hypothetical protein AB7P50_12095 [Alphaproteobacteria bacterium]
MPNLVKVSTLIAAATLALSACQSNTAAQKDPGKKPESISRHAVSPAATKSSASPMPGGIEKTRISAHDAFPDNPPGRSSSTSGYSTTTMGRVSSHRSVVAPGSPPATTTGAPGTTTAAPATPGTPPAMTPGIVSNEPYFQDDKPAMKKK